MARALDQIMTEYNTIYDPQRDVYNKQIAALPGMQDADLKGLDAAKVDSFNSITTGANRRGVAFGGIPLGEQASYLGSTYLPAVANLKNRYAGIGSDLAIRLAEVNANQKRDAQSVFERETEQDRLARDRATAAGSGGGSGGFNFQSPYGSGSAAGDNQPQATLRQTWQQQANAGDYEAQTALNYLDDNGRYDGPVNTTYEYNILKKMGAIGNYYDASAPTVNGSGLSVQGGQGATISGGSIKGIGAPSSNRLGGSSLRL